MKVTIDAVGIRGGGGASILCEFLKWFPIVRPNWEWQVFLLDSRYLQFELPNIVKTIRISYVLDGSSSLGRLKWIYFGLRKNIEKTDIIFSLTSIGSIYPLKPQVVMCHQPNIFLKDGFNAFPIYERIRLIFMRYCILQGLLSSKAIIVQTQTMKEQLLRFKSNLKNIYIIPSGYSTIANEFSIRSEKKKLIDNASFPRVIYVSLPRPPKNHINLIKALVLLRKKFPNISLLLTADVNEVNNSETGETIKNILKIARNLSVDKNIVWLGLLNQNEVKYAMRSSSLQIFPSLSESFGLPLVEAMAAGCPNVVSDLTFAHDVVGNSGVFFRPQDPQSIANSTISILENTELRDRLIKVGDERLKYFSYYNITNEIASVLQSIKSCYYR